MGRETKILLGLLGLLAGVFVGVLSMKLLVPRPPAGAGPDVHHDQAAAGTSHELVEPPTLSPRAWDFSAAPPLVAAAAPPGTAEPALSVRETRSTGPEYRSRFASTAAEPPPEELLPPAPPPVISPPAESRFGAPRATDPFASRPATQDAKAVAAQPLSTQPLSAQPPSDQSPPPQPLPAQPPVAAAPVTFERASLAVEPDLLPPVAAAPLSPAADRGSRTAGASPVQTAGALAFPMEPAMPAGLPLRAGEGYTVQPGDSWWSLAETAYGDGRLYRALFAWNRTLDGRVTLAPGTRLEIPPVSKLQAAWPALIPR